MRSFLKISTFLFISVFFLTACLPQISKQESASKNSVTEEVETVERYIGIVKTLGASIYMQGTHRLEKDNKLVVLLKSKQIDLDQFLDQEVEIEGKVKKVVEGDLKIMEVTFIAPLNSEIKKVESEKETGPVTIKTYQDSDFGFALKYLSLFEIKESRKGIAFYDKNNQKIVEITAEEGLTLPIGEDLTPIVVAGLPGIRKIETDKITIYVENNQKRFSLVWYDSDLENTERNKNYFYDIVASFQLGDLEVKAETEINIDSGTVVEVITKPEPEIASTTSQENISNAEKKIPEILNDNSSVDSEALSKLKSLVVKYLNANLSTLVPEAPAIGTSWSISRFEFIDPNQVYVEYLAGEQKRKLLLAYQINSNNIVTTQQKAYFLPGESRDWILQSGSDAGKTVTREVIGANGETLDTVREGYRLYENSHQNFTLQYPANWYWSNAGTDKVKFSEKPLDQNEPRIWVELVKGNNFNFGILKEVDNTVEIYLAKDEKESIKISGEQFYKEIIKAMADTLKSKK